MKERNSKISYKDSYQWKFYHWNIFICRKAAIAYNKAVDLAKAFGVNRNYSENYILDLSAKEYAETYTKIKISKKYESYLKGLPN